MALKTSDRVAHGALNSFETVVGTSAVVKIFTGSPPANCAAADSGTALAVINCPSDWMSAASGRSKNRLGTWEDTSANASGTAGHFRLYASDGTTCDMQGTVTATGGGGDMEINNTSIVAGQPVTVTQFTLNDVMG